MANKFNKAEREAARVAGNQLDGICATHKMECICALCFAGVMLSHVEFNLTTSSYWYERPVERL